MVNLEWDDRLCADKSVGMGEADSFILLVLVANADFVFSILGKFDFHEKYIDMITSLHPARINSN